MLGAYGEGAGIMRRVIFTVLAVVLAVIISLRVEREPAVSALAPVHWDGSRYNVMAEPYGTGDLQTAGSGARAEIESFYLGRVPTLKNACTGLLAGQNVVLVLASDWQADGASSILDRLSAEGARFADVYAPDWYQGPDGREFALLSGMTPVTVQERTALAWTGGQGICLPFALGSSLGRAGYDTWAFPARAGYDNAYGALGFGHVQTPGADLSDRLDDLGAGPWLAYWVLPGDGEGALTSLMTALGSRGLARNTAVCVLTGSAETLRRHMVLWGEGLAGLTVDMPCSELDITPTLLNLLGVEMDSRFFSGRDLFAPAGEESEYPVCLYGSAFSDWVTEKGRYEAVHDLFIPAAGVNMSQTERERYVSRMRTEVYDRYVYAGRVLQTDHFRAARG